MADEPAAAGAPAEGRRYCESCGEIFAASMDRCPECGVAWSGQHPASVREIARALTYLAGSAQGLGLPEATLNALSGQLEERLRRVRPPRRRGAHAATYAAQPPPPVAGTAVQAGTWPPSPPVVRAPAAPPKPPGPPITEVVTAWASERQADILLYLGAFLLSVAAVIFVAYTGKAVSDGVRFAILAGYTVAFLVLGLSLHRWERVKEAGPVFLGLGAILVPIAFVAFRTLITKGEGLPDDVLWLIGSGSCTALYILLSRRGYGRFYVIPAVPALLVAWGALGSVVGLRPEWFGAWFEVVAAALYLGAASGRFALGRWMTIGSFVIGFFAHAFAHAAATADDTQSAQLPVTYALTAAGLGGSLFFRRSVFALALLPIVGAVTILTAWWSAFGLAREWYPCFAAVAAVGYIVVAHFDRRGNAKNWGGPAAALAALALFAAHGAVLEDAADRAALPVTYGIVLAAAVTAFARWRWNWVETAAVLPVLGGMTVLSAMWATWDTPLEWYAPVIAGSAAGYLVLAHFRSADSRRWGAAAGVVIAVGIGWAHATVLPSGAAAWALPATYGVALALAGAASARWRWEWREALATLPALAAGLAVASAWAAWKLEPEWYGPIVVVAAFGYLVLAHLDTADWRVMWWSLALLGGLGGIAAAHGVIAEDPAADRAALPVAYGAGLGPFAAACARWRLALDYGLGAGPVLAVGLGASLLWAAADMPLTWLGSWGGGLVLGYVGLATVHEKRRSAWRAVAAAAAGASLAIGHMVALSGEPPRAQLPALHAALAAGALWDALRRGFAGLIALPALLAVGGASLLWSVDAGPEWWGFPALGLGAALVGVLCFRWPLERELRPAAWAYGALLTVVAALVFVPVQVEHGWHGLAGLGVASLVLGIVALRARGDLAGLAGRPTEQGALVERAALGHASLGLLFGAGGFLNLVAGLTEHERAWPYAGAGAAAWLVVAVLGRRRDAFAVFAPAAVTATIIAGVLAAPSDGASTAVYAIGAAGPVVAFVSTRRWLLLGVAFVALCGAMATFFRWQDLDTAFLPLAYGALAIASWAGFVGLRRYTDLKDEPSAVVAILSWAPWLVASATSVIFLGGEYQDPDRTDRLALSREWAAATAVLATLGAAVTVEGWRFRSRWTWVPGTVAMLGALLMAIAIIEARTDSAFTQPYTAPIGVYLVLLGLTWRSSAPLFGRHMSAHEALMVAGMLFLVLPPADQGFEPGGERYAFELIGLGLAFLAVGLALHARWLVPGGVLSLSGVAARWLFGGYVDVPFWLILGVLGMALLGVGMLILLQRERWDAARAAIARWWVIPPPSPEPPFSERPAPGA